MRVIEARAVITATQHGFDAVAAKIKQLGAAARSVSATSGRITAMGERTEAVGKRLVANGRRMTSAMTLPMALLAGFGGRAVYQFADVMNTIKAVTNLTDDQKVSLEAYIKDLNKILPFTNAQIATAALELGRAGLKFEQIMGSLRATMTLALAGDTGMQESADIATNIMTAMRLPMQSTEEAAASLTRTVDVLTYAANGSNTTVRQMGEAFKFVGPMAAAAGQDIETMAAAMMNFANSGIKGPEAGVGMRSLLVRMVKPTKDMLATLGRLGIDIGDFVKPGRPATASSIGATLQTGGISLAPGTLTQIGGALSDPRYRGNSGALTAQITDIVAGQLGDGSAIGRDKIAEAVSDALTIGGAKVDVVGFTAALKEAGANLGDVARIIDARQVARVLGLLNSLVDLRERIDDIRKNAPGTGERNAATRMEDIVGPVKRFNASIENLTLSIGRSGVVESAATAFDTMAAGLDKVAKMNPRIIEMTTYAVAAAAALGPLAFIFGRLAQAGGAVLKLIGHAMAPGTSAALAAAAKTPAGAAFLAGLPLMLAYQEVTNPGDASPSALKGRLDEMNLSPLQRALADRQIRNLGDILPGGAGDRDGRIDVHVKVDAGDGFWAKATSFLSGRLFGNSKKTESGSTGSTGTSMPEVGPMP